MNVPVRKSPRLRGYDYSKPGAYFVTICVKDRKNLLSKIKTHSYLKEYSDNSIVGTAEDVCPYKFETCTICIDIQTIV